MENRFFVSMIFEQKTPLFEKQSDSYKRLKLKHEIPRVNRFVSEKIGHL